MFKPHNDFKQIDDAAILWRYQDLARYIDLLLKRQLFFARADKFEDPFEGKYNKPSTEETLKSSLEKMPEGSKTKEDVEQVKRAIDEMRQQHEEKRTEVAVSS